MSDITPTGHLKIIKVYDDGSEEIHFDDSNVIVSGMGVALFKGRRMNLINNSRH